MNLPIVDGSDTPPERGNPTANVQAALDLIETYDPDNAARMQVSVKRVVIIDSVRPIRSDQAELWIGRDFTLSFPVESVAIGLIVGFAAMQLGQAARRHQAKVAGGAWSGEREAALAFTQRLPNPDHWQEWLAEWLSPASIPSHEQMRAWTIEDMRRLHIPEWFIGMLMRVYGWRDRLRRARNTAFGSRPAT